MKRIFSLVLACLYLASVQSQNSQPYFLSNPALSPDGETVVFAFEGDLWRASVKDGKATRITAMQGYESSPRISPDGQWLAFSSRQMGNADVYIMPLAGGEIKQLTFHSATDEVNNWSWDSKKIYFTSNRMGQISGFTIGINGGTPERLFGDHFFLLDHGLAEHPSGDIYFNDTWESTSQIARKRYKGPFNPDIQSYNIATKQYKKHTDWEGKDFAATIDKNGKLYFISDEANGEYNLYALDNGKKTALTRFNTSIKAPQVNAAGSKVVFERDYQLWLYDVSAKKAEKLNITLNRNYVLPAEKDYNVRGEITNLDVSPDGKKIAFSSRGEIFVSDADGKFIQQINKGNTERAKEVKWMSDNKTLLFNQTVDGFLNWYTVAADGSAGVKQITKDARNNRSGVLNKSRTKMVYLSGRDEVRLLDLKTWDNKILIKDEIWAIQNSDPGFSPNDEYVYYTAIRNFEQDIFIHHLKDNKTINLTNTGVTESSPVWSPDSKYIYFISSRTKPSYPFGMQNPRIYRMPLEKIDAPYRSDKYEALFKTEKKDTSKKEPAPIKIDASKIMDRLEQVGPGFGSQFLLNVLQKGEKTIVLYISNHAEGRSALWKTTLEPFEAPKTECINGADAFSVDYAEGGDKTLLLINGSIFKLNLDANKVDPVAIAQVFRRNLSAEFAQIFQETWAHVNENFYDEKFHGIDWLAMRKKYEAYVPYINTRGDLRTLLADLLGELNSSHQGFSSAGDEETVQLSNRTMETGIIFENNDPYKVKYIVAGSNADRSTIDIRPGDILQKVNDETVDAKTDRSYYFSKPSLDGELTLTFSRAGQTVTTKVHPQASLFANLSQEWSDINQKRVDEKTNNRVAYHNMKDMGTGELDKFLIDMTQDFYQKDALILDLRYNTGGNVHDEVLKFLSQRAYLQWKYREGKLTPQSNFAPADKPIVLLINEQSLSDAEMTSQGFKALKLGTIIGMPTYRWIIFTSGTGLVDGSFVRLPSWGCYSLDGKDLEITGVEPDIKIPMNFEDRINGRDPQLDKAIEEILKKLKK
ncbi:S41 family peptidase [Sediminibacterium goheungense]|uniref:Tricorn protease homolog n=1 Tax=Sediminibacterium goheungense TaxID=1086393 RepID=A0A4R6IVS0_9BACT|nr:S41 family peptidase [Sediminibacterium goheungense]TDO26770.1 tricorn protease-like protein [Sediminibacterium goheungense]